ncbi:MAG: Gfo/Idh/MocA family oxidoreductase [Planctomycetota bacterium]
MGKVKAGVVGLGVGRWHAAGYARSEHAKLEAVCDLIPERIAWAKREFGVTTYDDLDAFLAREDIEVVSVCTPDYTHIDVAPKAIRAGKNVLLEKPVALRIEDALKIQRLAAASRKLVGIGYEFRGCPVVAELKRLVDSGALGKVEAVSMYDWRGPFARNKWGRWIQSEEKSGGMVVEEVCHWFDLLRHLGGELEEVHCVWSDRVHEDFDFEDIAYINCRYMSGAAAHITHNLCGFGYLFDIWVVGRKGSARAIHKEDASTPIAVESEAVCGTVVTRRHWKASDFTEKGELKPGTSERNPVAKTTFGSEVWERNCIEGLAATFARCVVTGEEFPVSVEDGVKSLVGALAARRSAKERRVVRCEVDEVRES